MVVEEVAGVQSMLWAVRIAVRVGIVAGASIALAGWVWTAVTSPAPALLVPPKGGRGGC